MLRYTLAWFMAAILVAAAHAGGSGDHSHGHGHGAAKFSVGEPATGHAARVVDVSMRDTMRFVFDPALDSLKDGEVVEFVVRNDGNIVHEFSIGNAEEQVAHAKMMREMTNMRHEDANTVSPEPGKTSRIRWRFMGDDTVVFACNIPGHYEAGMHHKVPIMSTR